MKKQCFKCGLIKPKTDFYKHSKMADGFLNKCKQCSKHDSILNRENNIEYYRQYDRERNSLKSRKQIRDIWLKNNPIKSREIKAKWGRKNRLKTNAHLKVNRALKAGKITKLPCSICGNKTSQGHHDDYSKPLEVIWLCEKHHAARHRELNDMKRKQQ